MSIIIDSQLNYSSS